MAMGTGIITQNMSAAAMAANPSALSGRTINCNIESGLVLENAVIKRATFANSKIWNSTIRNVTFENCTFSQTHFMTTTFENVIFKGGSVSHRSSKNSYDEPSFEDVIFLDVVIDGVSLSEAYFQVRSRGTKLTLRNLTNIRNKYVTFYIGNSSLVMDNCKASGELMAVLSGERTTVYVNNCEFRKYSGIGGNCRSIYINNSKFFNFSHIAGGDNTVIQNSLLTGQIGHANIQQLYLVNNEHPQSDPKEPWLGRTVLRTHVDGKVFLDGRNYQNAYLTVVSGSVLIRDLNCVNLILGSPGKELDPQTFDLCNVDIKGLQFLDLNLKSARWENVRLEPPVTLDNARIASLQTYNSTIAQEFISMGASGNNGIRVTESPHPFNFPQIVAPTPESIGVRVE
ncbi:MAG: pentapeptide repeat-containing protein [Deltaproteobacteria bacterium]|jgi:uncharacterized protein YjbI with pentapeptide repeats|nr:pentapeptide repeat-containing protein [Deltaproteobacteria bacterium]